MPTANVSVPSPVWSFTIETVKLLVLSPGPNTTRPVFNRPLKVGWMKSAPACAAPGAADLVCRVLHSRLSLEVARACNGNGCGAGRFTDVNGRIIEQRDDGGRPEHDISEVIFVLIDEGREHARDVVVDAGTHRGVQASVADGG